VVEAKKIPEVKGDEKPNKEVEAEKETVENNNGKEEDEIDDVEPMDEDEAAESKPEEVIEINYLKYIKCHGKVPKKEEKVEEIKAKNCHLEKEGEKTLKTTTTMMYETTPTAPTTTTTTTTMTKTTTSTMTKITTTPVMTKSMVPVLSKIAIPQQLSSLSPEKKSGGSDDDEIDDVEPEVEEVEAEEEAPKVAEDSKAEEEPQVKEAVVVMEKETNAEKSSEISEGETNEKTVQLKESKASEEETKEKEGGEKKEEEKVDEKKDDVGEEKKEKNVEEKKEGEKKKPMEAGKEEGKKASEQQEKIEAKRKSLPSDISLGSDISVTVVQKTAKKTPQEIVIPSTTTATVVQPQQKPIPSPKPRISVKKESELLDSRAAKRKASAEEPEVVPILDESGASKKSTPDPIVTISKVQSLAGKEGQRAPPTSIVPASKANTPVASVAATTARPAKPPQVRKCLKTSPDILQFSSKRRNSSISLLFLSGRSSDDSSCGQRGCYVIGGQRGQLLGQHLGWPPAAENAALSAHPASSAWLHYGSANGALQSAAASAGWPDGRHAVATSAAVGGQYRPCTSVARRGARIRPVGAHGRQAGRSYAGYARGRLPRAGRRRLA